jgi:hypothetical protein
MSSSMPSSEQPGPQAQGDHAGYMDPREPAPGRGAPGVVNTEQFAGELDDEERRLLAEVAGKMQTDQHDALRYTLRAMLSLYDAKAEGGNPNVKYKRGRLRKDFEQGINLPGT